MPRSRVPGVDGDALQFTELTGGIAVLLLHPVSLPQPFPFETLGIMNNKTMYYPVREVLQFEYHMSTEVHAL